MEDVLKEVTEKEIPLDVRVKRNLNKSAEQILAEHQVLSFDAKLAKEMCEKQRLPFYQRVVLVKTRKGEFLRLRDFLKAFKTVPERVRFLARYAEVYDDKKELELNAMLKL